MIDFVDLFNACLYIQDNLEADLSLLFLAQTVGLSRFRFHRVFKAWRGETLHDFVTRMRMERAAFELRYPIPHSSRRSIKSIAFASGYKSLSSFSHAFSAYAQLSPREFRNRALRTRPPVVPAGEAGDAFAPFSIEVSEEPERRIAVLEAATVSPERRNVAGMSDSSGPLRIDGDRYGVELLPHLLARSRMQRHLPGKFRHLGSIGVELSDWEDAVERLPGDRRAPRSTIRLDAGRYAVISGSGSMSALYRAWRSGFDDWLAVTGECPKSGRLYARFAAGRVGTKDDGSRLSLFIPLETPAVMARRTRHRPRLQQQADLGSIAA